MTMRLTPLAPDPSRAETVRVRCRAQLAQATARAERAEARLAFRRLLVPLLLGTLSAGYAAALLAATIRIERWLR